MHHLPVMLRLWVSFPSSPSISEKKLHVLSFFFSLISFRTIKHTKFFKFFFLFHFSFNQIHQHFKFPSPLLFLPNKKALTVDSYLRHEMIPDNWDLHISELKIRNPSLKIFGLLTNRWPQIFLSIWQWNLIFVYIVDSIHIGLMYKYPWIQYQPLPFLDEVRLQMNWTSMKCIWILHLQSNFIDAQTETCISEESKIWSNRTTQQRICLSSPPNL